MKDFFARHRRSLAAAAIVVIAIAGYFEVRAVLGAKNTQAVTYVTQTVARGTLVTSVSGTGNVALADNYQVVPAVSGTVSGLSVKIGDRVTKGKLLFTVVNGQLDLDVVNAQAAYDQAAAGIQTAKLNVLQAEQSLQQLQQQYDNQFTTTTRPPTTASPTRATPTTHRPTTATSSTPLTTAPPTTQPATTTTTAVSSTATPLLVQPVSFLVAAAPSGSGGTTAAATTASTVTQIDLDVAEQKVTTAQLGVTTAQNSLTQAKYNLTQAKTAAAERQVKASANGIVTALNVANGDTVGTGSSTSRVSSTPSATGGASSASSASSAQSSSSSSSTSALDISNAGLMNAVVQLNEVDVTQLKGGEKATMTFDAVSGLTLAGSVTAIDTVGTVTQGVVTYNVSVGFDASGTAVRPGMTVTAAIVTSVAQNVLSVPNAAVKTSGNGQYVQVIPGVGQAPVQRTVTVGVATDTSTQIVSGVNEGDNVVTQTINPNTTATTVGRSGGLGIPGLGGGGGGATRGFGGGGAGFRPPGG